MSDKVTEIEALRQIDSLLCQLNEEEINRIFIFVSAKYNVKANQTNIPQHSNRQNEPTFSNPLPSELSIKEFISFKKPIGFYETITCLGYYLEKVLGMDGFKTLDITQANKDARLHPMSNPTFFVNDATSKYGFLMPIGSGKKVLSAKGEAVVNALPDREKVNQILEEYPVKRKPIKKTNKKINHQ